MKPSPITHLILDTSSNHDEYNGNCDYCLIPLSAEYVSYLVGWMDHVNRLYQADHSVNSIDCWDYRPDHFPVNEVFEQLHDSNGNLAVEVPDGEPILLTTDPGLDPKDFQRVECQTVRIGRDSLWWSAYVKHTDVRIKSASLDRKTLQQIQRSFGAAKTNHPHPVEAIHPVIQELHDLLYKDIQGRREFYNLHKVQDADLAFTVAAVAKILGRYIPRPRSSDNPDPPVRRPAAR